MKEFPDPWRELGEFIREQRSVARLSVRRLSDMAGISNPYLSQIERGLRRPSAEILKQIARALRISAETLYVRAGILDASDAEGNLASAILAEPSLTEDQKETLLRVYKSFRRENDWGNPTAPTRGEGDERVDSVESEEEVADATAADRPAPGERAAGERAAGEPGAGEPVLGGAGRGKAR
jgi:transcriptional regulator with XRE-family HTH domain